MRRSANLRARRWRRVSTEEPASVAWAAIGSEGRLGSGLGSVSGSRFMEAWSSIPEAEQTMQQRREPVWSGPLCGHFEGGVSEPIGKSGTSSSHQGVCGAAALGF